MSEHRTHAADRPRLEDVLPGILADPVFVANPVAALAELIRYRDRHVAAEALREAAGEVDRMLANPQDELNVEVLSSLQHANHLTAWLRALAEEISSSTKGAPHDHHDTPPRTL